MLDEDKLAALIQEWSSLATEKLVMFDGKVVNKRLGPESKGLTLFPVCLWDAKRRERWGGAP